MNTPALMPVFPFSTQADLAAALPLPLIDSGNEHEMPPLGENLLFKVFSGRRDKQTPRPEGIETAPLPRIVTMVRSDSLQFEFQEKPGAPIHKLVLHIPKNGMCHITAS